MQLIIIMYNTYIHFRPLVSQRDSFFNLLLGSTKR